jgi:hypothetical protein
MQGRGYLSRGGSNFDALERGGLEAAEVGNIHLLAEDVECNCETLEAQEIVSEITCCMRCKFWLSALPTKTDTCCLRACSLVVRQLVTIKYI